MNKIDTETLILIKEIAENFAKQGSTPANVIISIIPIVGIVFGSVVLFFFLYWHNKQKLAEIEKGIYKRINFRMFIFLAGCLSTAVGIALTIVLAFLEGLSYSILGGVIPLSVGLGAILFFILEKYIHINNNNNHK